MVNYYRFEFRGKTYEIGKSIINLNTGKRVRSSEYSKEEYNTLYNSEEDDPGREVVLEIVVMEIVVNFLDRWAERNNIYSEDPLVVREFDIKELNLPQYITVSNGEISYDVSLGDIIDDWIVVNF